MSAGVPLLKKAKTKNKKNFELIKTKISYTWSYAPADFNGALLTHEHFQKNAEISRLCNFHYKSDLIPSLMHFGY